MDITIRRYDKATDLQLWENLIANSRNATFMHHRAYMDYHSDRFEDCSLMAFKGNNLIAVLPANISGDTLCSHQGLTFAGWLCDYHHTNVNCMMEIFQAMRSWAKAQGIRHIIYKPIPHIYHRYPCEEDLYCLWRNGAQIVVSNISTTIELNAPIRFNENARRSIKLAQKNGITVGESTDLAGFWQILCQVLEDRHHTTPVHSLEEITLLQSRFTKDIRLFTAQREGVLLGGTLIYESDRVAHAQYIASSPEGHRLKVLPLVFDHLVNSVYKDSKQYFDFGTSNEQDGVYLNAGLVTQKTGMGGRGIIYNIYKMDV